MPESHKATPRHGAKFHPFVMVQCNGKQVVDANRGESKQIAANQAGLRRRIGVDMEG